MTDHRDEHETYGHTHSPVIEDLRKQVATLLDEQTGFRVAIAQLTAERDEARRSCCEFAAMVDSADTVLMYVDSNRFHEIAMRYMKSRGWDCFKEDGK
jgi:pyruvate/oxaloacetate carboxyltransferase